MPKLFKDLQLGDRYHVMGDTHTGQMGPRPYSLHWTKIDERTAVNCVTGKTIKADADQAVRQVVFLSSRAYWVYHWLNHWKGEGSTYQLYQQGDKIFQAKYDEKYHFLRDVDEDVFYDMFSRGWIEFTSIAVAPKYGDLDYSGSKIYAMTDDMKSLDVQLSNSDIAIDLAKLLHPVYPHISESQDGFTIKDKPYMVKGGRGPNNDRIYHKCVATVSENKRTGSGYHVTLCICITHRISFDVPSMEEAERLALLHFANFDPEGKPWYEKTFIQFSDARVFAVRHGYSAAFHGVSKEFVRKQGASSRLSPSTPKWHPYYGDTVTNWTPDYGTTEQVFSETYRVDLRRAVIERLDMYTNVIETIRITRPINLTPEDSNAAPKYKYVWPPKDGVKA